MGRDIRTPPYGGKQTYRERTKPWYGLARWRRRRDKQLRDEPLCWMCKEEGHTVEATIADHDPPHRGDPHIFWHGKLRSLCKAHHDGAKQSEERTGRKRTAIGLDGWPVE